MDVTTFVLSVVAFVLSLGAIAIAVRHVIDAKELSASQARISRLQAEISVIEADMAREFREPEPDLGQLRHRYRELAARASELLGGDHALAELVGMLNAETVRDLSG